MMRKILLTMLICLAAHGATRAQMLALKTNALYDLALVPNIGIEVATGSKTSVAVNGFATWYILGMSHAKAWGFVPEFRYWFSGSTFSKFYVEAGATIARFKVCPSATIYNGSAYGAGINVGYNYWLTKRISVDFHGGVGLYYHSHARYLNTDQDLPEIPDHNYKGWVVLPYQIGVSFVYILK